MQKFFLRTLIRVIREIIVEETAVRRKAHASVFGNDAVDVEIAARIFDIDITDRIHFEPVCFAFFLSGRDLEGNGISACIRPVHGARRIELDAICGNGISRFLQDISRLRFDGNRIFC